MRRGDSARTLVCSMVAVIALVGCDRSKHEEPSAPSVSAPTVAGSGSQSPASVPEARSDTETEPGLAFEPLGPAPEGPLAVVAGALERGQSSEVVADVEATRRRPFHAPTEKWRARVGLTTFRSTIHVHEGMVIINSNGASWKSTRDREDAVLGLDARTGAAKVRFVPPGNGEKDCNGVALTPNGVVFGTDQGDVLRYTWDGKLLWRTHLDGDVEAMPAFADVNGDGKADVVVGTEAGTVFAVSGADGKVIWKAHTGKGSYGQFGIVGGVALADVSGDGAPEVFVAARDGALRALDGRTGRTRWQFRSNSGMHASPILIDVEGDGRLEVAFSESYGVVYLAEADSGRLRWSTKLAIGLMGPLGWYPDARCLVAGTAWFGEHEKVHCVSIDDGQSRWDWEVAEGKLSSGYVVGDVDGKPGEELVFGTENGALMALSPEGRVVWQVDVQAPIECTPTLADLDGDDRLDVLTSANDGYLRAFSTSGFPPASVGYHRGDATNSGRL